MIKGLLLRSVCGNCHHFLVLLVINIPKCQYCLDARSPEPERKYKAGLILERIQYLLFIIIFADVNECTDGLHNCTDLENKTCSNTNGSFECVCDIGYEGDDECVGMLISMLCIAYLLFKN